MRILLAQHDKDRYHFRLGYFVIFATNQIPRVGCPPRKMRLQDTNGRFFAFLKTTLHRCWTAQVSGYYGINCFHLFFIWEARVGLTILTKMSSLIAVMGYEVSKKKKNNIEGSAFSQAGSLPVLFDRSHLGNIFGRWSGSRRTVFCEYWYPLNGTESGKLRGVGRILGVVPLLH